MVSDLNSLSPTALQHLLFMTNLFVFDSVVVFVVVTTLFVVNNSTVLCDEVGGVLDKKVEYVDPSCFINVLAS